MTKKTILLVEDNQDDAELTMRAFNKSGVNNSIHLARDGVEALDYLFGRGEYAEKLSKADESVAFILLDLKLPRIDGHEVLKKIRSSEKTNLIPVVIFSSSGEETDLVRSYRLGANSYIRKPVDFTRSTEIIKHLCTYWLDVNETAPC